MPFLNYTYLINIALTNRTENDCFRIYLNLTSVERIAKQKEDPCGTLYGLIFPGMLLSTISRCKTTQKLGVNKGLGI